MIRVIRTAWQSVRGVLQRWIHPGRLRSIGVVELPDSPQRDRLYVIGSGTPWSAALLCPCGCGELIHLSLLVDDSPSWGDQFRP